MDKRMLTMGIAEALADRKGKEQIPYGWGGNDPGIDGPGVGVNGLDCSGLIRFCVRISGLIPFAVDLRAQDFFNAWKDKRVAEAYYGCVAFYGKGHAEIKHVVFCVDRREAIGASKINGKAAVQRHKLHYRPDLIAIVDPFL